MIRYTRQDLEAMNIIRLAVLCGQLADADTTDKETAEKAHKMKMEWAKLVAREPGLTLKQHDEIEAEKETLKKRMVDFLE